MRFHDQTPTSLFRTAHPPEALARTTHLCVAAHQDDIEIMAYHGIAECFGRKDRWFTGVVVTNGAGSPRTGIYGEYTDEEMQQVRLREQRKAAYVGEYACQIQLVHPSSAVKKPATRACSRISRPSAGRRPEVVYLHNPADKHDTHVACCLRAIAALRACPGTASVAGARLRGLARPGLAARRRQAGAAGRRAPNLAASLVGVFDSQVSGGKRYDLATWPDGAWRTRPSSRRTARTRRAR